MATNGMAKIATEDNSEEDISENELKIRATSGYFTSLLELIPTKHYVNSDIDELTNSNNPRSSKKTKSTPVNKKLLAKKAKLFKLDPAMHKTATELQLEIENKEKELFAKESLNEAKIEPISVSNLPSKPVEELRQKLHEKVAVLSSKRAVSADKSKTKKRRADKHVKDDISKKKAKLSENIKRVNKIESDSMQNDNNAKSNGHSDVVFSKFDFATPKNDVRKKKKNKSKEELLHIAEKKQEKLSELEKTDLEKANEVKKSNAWSSAFKKAEGIKLKDDPKLLKKSIKKKQKQKEQSKKKWKERVETVSNSKEERQKLRTKNIKERKEAKNNKDKKTKKKPKKGF